MPSPADEEDGSNGDPSQDKPLGRKASKIGLPPFKLRYRKKWGAPGLYAWTPSLSDIYQFVIFLLLLVK